MLQVECVEHIFPLCLMGVKTKLETTSVTVQNLKGYNIIFHESDSRIKK